MGTLAAFVLPVAMAAVAIVLFAGLANMMRGGSPNLSQKLMRARIVLQFTAIVLMMTVLYFAAR